MRRQIELTCLLLPSFQFRLFILTPNKCTQFEFDCVLYVNQKMKNVGLLFVVLQFFFKILAEMANKFQWDLMQIEKFHFEIELTSNAHESCAQLKENPCFFSTNCYYAAPSQNY